MKIENLTADQKSKCYIEFKTRCYYVYRTYQINRVLFEENENTEKYPDLDCLKFINNALIDHILLQLHIITDKANFGKSNKNLSVFFFLEWNWEIDVKRKLSELAQNLKKFVTFKHNKNPRHKLLAHWDVETILMEAEPLGSFRIGEEIDFFKNLNQFIQIMQEAMGLQDSWDILTEKKADEIKLQEILKYKAN